MTHTGAVLSNPLPRLDAELSPHLTHKHTKTVTITSNSDRDTSHHPDIPVGHLPSGRPIIVLAALGVHSSVAFDTKEACHCFYNIME